MLLLLLVSHSCQPQQLSSRMQQGCTMGTHTTHHPPWAASTAGNSSSHLLAVVGCRALWGRQQQMP